MKEKKNTKNGCHSDAVMYKTERMKETEDVENEQIEDPTKFRKMFDGVSLCRTRNGKDKQKKERTDQH